MSVNNVMIAAAAVHRLRKQASIGLRCLPTTINQTRLYADRTLSETGHV